jgi:hypothetical protein
MAGSILSTLLGAPSFSVTDESTGAAIWTDLGIVDVEVMLSSENTDQPLSNQQVDDISVWQDILAADVASVKIISPDRLRVTALCADLSTVKSIIAYFNNLTATMSINTKSIITRYLALSECDIEQSGEMISAVRIVMVFEQAQPSESTGYAPAQDADQSVYGISIANPPSVVPLATLTKAIASATSSIAPIVSGALIDSLGGPFILDSSKLS